MKIFNFYLKLKLLDKLLFILIILLSIMSYFPPTQAFQYYNPTKLTITLLIIIVMFIDKPFFFMSGKVIVLSNIAFIIYTLVLPHLFGNSMIGNRYLDIGQIYVFYLVYMFYKERIDILLYILKVNYPLILLTSLVTTSKLIKDPYISRRIKSSGEISRALKMQIVGGYEFIYFLIPLVLILFFDLMIRYKKKKKIKVAHLFIFGLLFLNILISNYFTALIITLLGMLIILMSFVDNVSVKFIVSMLFVVSSFFAELLILFGIKTAISILSAIGVSGKTILRLSSLITNESNVFHSIGLIDRYETLKLSMSGFASNPIFGNFYKNLLVDGQLKGFGQHSFFLDTFYLFGMLIGVLTISITIYPVLKHIKDIDYSGLKYSLLTFILLLSSINNMTASIGFGVYIIALVYVQLYKSNYGRSYVQDIK